jgi:hypothetical protein
MRYVRVVDFGTGDYSTDYTGHAFIPNYLYDRQKFLLNNTFEANTYSWHKVPYSQQNPQPSQPHNPALDYRLQLSADPNVVKLVRPIDTDPVYAQNKQQLEQFYKQFQNSPYKENFNQNNPLNNNQPVPQLPRDTASQPTASPPVNFNPPQNPHHEVKIDSVSLNYPKQQQTQQQQQQQQQPSRNKRNHQHRRRKQRDNLAYEPHPVYMDKAYNLYEFQKNRFKDSNIDKSQYSMNELSQNQFSQNQYFLNQYKEPNLRDPNLLAQPSQANTNQQANLNFNSNPSAQFPVPVLNNMNLNPNSASINNQQQYFQPQALDPKNPHYDRPYYNPGLMQMSSSSSQLNRHSSLDQFSPFLFINKNTVPIHSWDPLLDTDRVDMNRVADRNAPVNGFDKWYIKAIEGNIDLDSWKMANENPLYYQNMTYIDTYRYANVWWGNESVFAENKQEYVFRIKPEESFVKFRGAKHEDGVTWTSPYFWCPDASHWLVTAKSPIWATNDFHYKNRIFESKEPFR